MFFRTVVSKICDAFDYTDTELKLRCWLGWSGICDLISSAFGYSILETADWVILSQSGVLKVG